MNPEERDGGRRRSGIGRGAVMSMLAVLLACSGAARRVQLYSAESPTTGPAGAAGTGGTGAAGSFGSGGTMGGTSIEAARETPGGPSAQSLPRDYVLDGGVDAMDLTVRLRDRERERQSP